MKQFTAKKVTGPFQCAGCQRLVCIWRRLSFRSIHSPATLKMLTIPVCILGHPTQAQSDRVFCIDLYVRRREKRDCRPLSSFLAVFFRERWISKCHWQLVFRKRVGDISSPFISLPPVSLQVSLWHTLRSATCRCGHGTSKPWLIKHLFTDVPLLSYLFIFSCCQSVCDGLKVVVFRLVLAICVFFSCALLLVVTVRCHSLLFGFFFHSVLL